MNRKALKHKISEIIASEKSTDHTLQTICDFLKNEIHYFDWVGFYFKNGNKNELKLSAYAGEETEHTIIPFGKGICGQVALSNENFIVQDVEEQENYISCGWKVKSEIVIPIFVDGQNIGQIDIDSHTVSPFTSQDEELLEFTCKLVAPLLPEHLSL
ncbi:MAG: histidine kinase [Flavobacteriaceae bacterium]|nr:MAG: histidine kinase [Flavobacteriaceae bacterium]